MDNSSLYNVEHAIRREIYGYSFVVDENKKLALMENLRAYQLHYPDALFNFDELEPLIDKLCSLEHVRVVSMPNFIVFEEVESDSFYSKELHSKPLMTTLHLVASFSGFVDQVEKDISYGGHPKYYYIHSIMDHDSKKIVRYTTYVTGNRLIDGPGKKKTLSQIFGKA